jgi:hypothetical protein
MHKREELSTHLLHSIQTPPSSMPNASALKVPLPMIRPNDLPIVERTFHFILVLLDPQAHLLLLG